MILLLSYINIFLFKRVNVIEVKCWMFSSIVVFKRLNADLNTTEVTGMIIP